MFGRFTQKAQKVIALSQEEAIRLRHTNLGTEHILLGLIREGEGIAAQA
ncbi:ClpC ATPase [Brochothrix campestris FSL F6-1037]|uniref:ClpC ATPase n=3 Tax=Brochothrix campestris TaxID=2757 RepID=W7CMX3_9LIST|nr:ClpC ATPase [Brochothrix campestris FSL F6-1037]